jgi:hypothetical protein
MEGFPSSCLTLQPAYSATSATSFIRDPIELSPGTYLLLNPEDVRTAVEERKMASDSET